MDEISVKLNQFMAKSFEELLEVDMVISKVKSVMENYCPSVLYKSLGALPGIFPKALRDGFFPGNWTEIRVKLYLKSVGYTVTKISQNQNFNLFYSLTKNFAYKINYDCKCRSKIINGKPLCVNNVLR